MKIYHTETQADYDALMIELEEQGIETIPKEYWKNYRCETVVFVHAIDKNHNSNKNDTTYSNVARALYNCPETPIIKYKAKADERMKFTKENVLKLTNEWIEHKIGGSLDLQNAIMDLDDKPEKVGVPKYIADYLIKAQDEITLMRVFEIANAGNELKKWKKEYDWIRKNSEKFAKAWIDDYTIEPDTATEQRYTVVIADRYLTQLFMGRTDYRFVEFDELWAWEPSAFQLTEAEIKAIDERYWAFAVKVEEE